MHVTPMPSGVLFDHKCPIACSACEIADKRASHGKLPGLGYTRPTQSWNEVSSRLGRNFKAVKGPNRLAYLVRILPEA